MSVRMRLRLAAVTLVLAACGSAPAYPESPWDDFAVHDFAALGIEGAWHGEDGLLLEYRVVIDQELPDHVIPAVIAWTTADTKGNEARRGPGRSVKGEDWAELVAAAEPVTILSEFEWVEQRKRYALAFAPAEPSHANVMRLAEREWVVYRDADGHIQDTSMEAIPGGLAIDTSFSAAESLDRFLAATQAYLGERSLAEREVVYATGATDTEYSAVYIDLDEAIVILHEASPPSIADSFGRTVAATGKVGKRVLSGIIDIVQRPVTNANRLVHAVGWTAYDVVKPSNWTPQLDELPPLHEGPGMDLDAFEATLDDVTGTDRVQGRVDLLIDGDAYFPRLMATLASAQRRVDMRMFIFKTDDFGTGVADLLRRRSEEIDVKVLLDGVGTLMGSGDHAPGLSAGFVPPTSIAAYLETDSDVSTRVRTPAFFRADHVKTITVDQQLTFLGGMNIGREYRYAWHDIMVEVQGPIVDQIDVLFRDAWVHAGWWGDYGYVFWKLFRGRNETPPREGDYPIRVLRTDISGSQIYKAQVAAIGAARRRIVIENAYFSDNEILTELVKARGRGVDVRVILPVHGNHAIMNASNLVMANVMLANGIRVYLYPGMTHVKAAIYDGWACLGSANFDRLSLRRNAELNLGYSDPGAVDELWNELFEVDMAKSLEVTEPFDVDFSDQIQEFLANVL